MVKNPPANARDAGDARDAGFDPWVRKSPWGRKWQPTPEFLLGKSHEQRSLVGYSPWGRERVRHDLASDSVCTHVHATKICCVCTSRFYRVFVFK